MRIALLLMALLCAARAQALELVSPTGNLLSSGEDSDDNITNFKRLTLNFHNEFSGGDNTLEINGDVISWTEKRREGTPRTRTAPFSGQEHLEVVRLLEREQFMDIRGAFMERGLHDATVETLALDKSKLNFIQNYGSLAPLGYKRIKAALMELQARKFPEPGEKALAPKVAPMFQGLQFHFTTSVVGKPSSESDLSVSIQPEGHHLPRYYAMLFRHVGQNNQSRTDAMLSEEEVDRLVERINRVPWEEIAGRYRSPQNGLGLARPTTLSFVFQVEGGTRTVEVSGLENGPDSYRELEKFLRAFIVKRFESKTRTN